MIVGDQDGEGTADLDLVAFDDDRSGRLAGLEREVDPECRPLARDAVIADPSFHEADEFAGDGQPKAGTAEFARDRAVGLLEAGEEIAGGLWVEPDPGVGDHYPDTAGLGQGDDDGDLAPRRELHRVRDQVVQDLTQTIAVT